jgi:hypothetical protein
LAYHLVDLFVLVVGAQVVLSGSLCHARRPLLCHCRKTKEKLRQKVYLLEVRSSPHSVRVQLGLRYGDGMAVEAVRGYGRQSLGRRIISASRQDRWPVRWIWMHFLTPWVRPGCLHHAVWSCGHAQGSNGMCYIFRRRACRRYTLRDQRTTGEIIVPLNLHALPFLFSL